jgi:hypothetical protein
MCIANIQVYDNELWSGKCNGGSIMEPTKKMRIVAVSLFFVSLTVVQRVYAHDVRQQAWALLNTGLTNKTSAERALAVGVLGLLTNDAQAPQLALTKGKIRGGAHISYMHLNGRDSYSRWPSTDVAASTRGQPKQRGPDPNGEHSAISRYTPSKNMCQIFRPAR